MDRVLVIPNFITKDECSYILNNCINDYELTEAGVYNENPKTSLKPFRKSKVSFVTNIGEVEERILDTVINHVGKIKGYIPFLDYFQFTKYEEGDYFHWHTDSNHTIYKDRFYTVVLQLTNDYEGGEFQLSINGNEITLEKGDGNLFIFPSDMLHRVKPITKNVRYSLVSWLKLKPLNNINKTLL